MSRTVFILGAGASVEAGAPMMANFLDTAHALRRRTQHGLTQAQMEKFDLVFRAIAALQAAHSRADLDIINLESVFGAFEMARLVDRLPPLSADEVKQLTPAMRALIVATLEQSIEIPAGERGFAAPRPYDGFMEVIGRMMKSELAPISFITFNYDLVLDFALFHYGQEIDYCFNDIATGGTPVMKLHGSVNWARCTACRAISPWTLRAHFSQIRYHVFGQTAHLGVAKHLESYLHCPGQPSEPEPIIVPPTWNKAEYQAEYHQVATVWKHAARHLAEAENIIVIGYSLPESDQFFRYLFALGTIGDARPQRFWLADPDPTGQVAGRFRKLLGPAFESRFRHFEEPFSSAIARIEGMLGLPSG